jgi:hypothetical protein
MSGLHIDIGTTGAKRQSFRGRSARAALLQIMQANPQAEKEEIWALCRADFIDGKKYYEELFDAWFGNNYTALIKPKKAETERSFASETPAEPDEPDIMDELELEITAEPEAPVEPEIPAPPKTYVSVEQRSAVQELVTERFKERVRISLLDMVLPNGKALGDCTREELAAADHGLHTCLSALVEKLQPGQTARQAGFTEEQLRELYPATD